MITDPAGAVRMFVKDAITAAEPTSEMFAHESICRKEQETVCAFPGSLWKWLFGDVDVCDHVGGWIGFGNKSCFPLAYSVLNLVWQGVSKHTCFTLHPLPRTSEASVLGPVSLGAIPREVVCSAAAE